MADPTPPDPCGDSDETPREVAFNLDPRLKLRLHLIDACHASWHNDMARAEAILTEHINAGNMLDACLFLTVVSEAVAQQLAPTEFMPVPQALEYTNYHYHTSIHWLREQVLGNPSQN